LEEKEDRITQLEDRLSEISKEDGDKAQLLETVQSNKTALSRALSQNKELKHQLAELQNGFVKMVSTVDSRYLEFDGTMEKIRVNRSSTQEEL
jgi:Mg2+ and Co2+ transporter CorA